MWIAVAIVASCPYAHRTKAIAQAHKKRQHGAPGRTQNKETKKINKMSSVTPWQRVDDRLNSPPLPDKPARYGDGSGRGRGRVRRSAPGSSQALPCAAAAGQGARDARCAGRRTVGAGCVGPPLREYSSAHRYHPPTPTRRDPVDGGRAPGTSAVRGRPAPTWSGTTPPPRL